MSNEIDTKTVLVSTKKPVSNYAAVSLAILTKHGEVIVKGVGSAIRKVVDVCEFLKNKYGDVSVEYASETIEDGTRKRSLLIATIKKG